MGHKKKFTLKTSKNNELDVLFLPMDIPHSLVAHITLIKTVNIFTKICRNVTIQPKCVFLGKYFIEIFMFRNIQFLSFVEIHYDVHILFSMLYFHSISGHDVFGSNIHIMVKLSFWNFKDENAVNMQIIIAVSFS